MASARTGPIAVILLLWLGITALDLNKAFHIDDAFHLQAAQWIGQHPSTPMTGMVQWGYDPEPIHQFNQPPGFFYLVGLTGQLFGYREVPMHLMRSLFTLLAIVCMYRLARHRTPRNALLLTALFAVCPAFMVNQGLMTDVPLASFILLSAMFLLVPGHGSKAWRYTLAGLALSAALMIKYSALPLLVVMIAAMVLRREWRMLPLALIPVAVLAAWSAWNLHEYGSIHILDRQGGDSTVRGIFVRNLALFTALGAVSPFTPAFLGAFGLPSRKILWGWLAALAGAFVLIVLAYAQMIPEPWSDQVLRISFTLNGVLIMALCARFLPRSLHPDQADDWILAAWAFGIALFLTLFSPMMATRHLLLLLPPILLLIAPALEKATTRMKILAVGGTALLGTILTVADKAYADFYRRQAPIIAEAMRARTTGTVWSLGAWGWKWYSGQAGLPSYGTRTSRVSVGDILVIPQDHDAQPLAEGLVVEPIAMWDEAPGPATFFNGERDASMYSSGYERPPWTLSRTHRKAIIAYRVTAVP